MEMKNQYTQYETDNTRSLNAKFDPKGISIGHLFKGEFDSIANVLKNEARNVGRFIAVPREEFSQYYTSYLDGMVKAQHLILETIEDVDVISFSNRAAYIIYGTDKDGNRPSPEDILMTLVNRDRR